MRTMRVRPGLMSQGTRIDAALARQRSRPSVGVSPHGPGPNDTPADIRTPPEAGLCEGCGRPLARRRPQRVYRPRGTCQVE
jgi:hypothetical protein